MLYKNAYVFDEKKSFIFGGFTVENDSFSSVFAGECDAEGVDLRGSYVIPGLVDIHTHGNSGADFSDGDVNGLRKMAGYLAKNGITSFAPTSMTLPYETLAKAFNTATIVNAERPGNCARVMGIHMEGPFFSEKKKGAQNAAYLKLPDYEAFSQLYNGCKGLLRIVDVAPELPGAVDFTRSAKELCTVSVAHTDSDYEHARDVFTAGASHLTHLFNAMPPIHHRNPGVIGAASEQENVAAELICDGLHVHPSSVRMAFKLFPGRICLISDALRCCGMPNGAYELGGQTVYLDGRIARLEDGTIAGSASNLFDCLHNAIAFGVPRDEAILAATSRPAREIGRENEIGSITVGKYADFLVCSEQLELKQVYLGGIPVTD